jgi:phosphohistidine swiveling domain-containing protein
MNTQDILTHIKETSWYKQGGAVLPLFIHLPYLSCYEEWGLGSVIIVQKNNDNEGYFDKSAEKKVAEKYLAAFLEDGRFLEKRIAEWRLRVEKQQDLLREAMVAPDEDFGGLMKEYCAATIAAWTLSILIEPFDPWGDTILHMYASRSQISDEELAALTAPRNLTFVQQERIDWLSVIQTGDPELLKKHAEKYYWIETSWQHSTALGEEYFKERLVADQAHLPALEDEVGAIRKYHAELQYAREELLQSKKLDTETASVLDFFSQLSDWRDERKKEQVCKADYGVMRLAEKLAELNGLSIDLMNHAALFEIFSRHLSADYIDTLERRARAPYAMWKNRSGVIEWFEGDEASRIIEQFEKAFQASFKEITGRPAYPGTVTGAVRIVNGMDDIGKMRQGDILVSIMTRPELASAMKKAGAIVTDEGGITCHAAIISRELKIPCIVGTQVATHALKDGDLIEVDADEGTVKIISKVA